MPGPVLLLSGAAAHPSLLGGGGGGGVLIEKCVRAFFSIRQDGRVNVARAKKKKRLDDEYEALLEGIEAKRAAVSELDAEMAKVGRLGRAMGPKPSCV